MSLSHPRWTFGSGLFVAGALLALALVGFVLSEVIASKPLEVNQTMLELVPGEPAVISMTPGPGRLLKVWLEGSMKWESEPALEGEIEIHQGGRRRKLYRISWTPPGHPDVDGIDAHYSRLYILRRDDSTEFDGRSLVCQYHSDSRGQILFTFRLKAGPGGHVKSLRAIIEPAAAVKSR